MSSPDTDDILEEIAALVKMVEEIAEKVDEILHLVKMHES